jgi:hypothetical protein
VLYSYLYVLRSNMVTHLKEAVGASTSTELAVGKFRAKLISADAWGSSAYYTSEVLKRDGSRVFHKGLHMYQDHLSESEQWDKPEGSIANLVGTLESDAEFEENGPEGPGLYSDVKFYPSYVSRISELKEDVGLSVDAQGLTESGERDGRFGPILVALLSAKSVDVVTKAGAGGKLMHMIESDRGLAGRPVESKEKSAMTDVTKEDFDGLVAKFDALPGLFAEALKTAGVVPAAQTPAETPAAETTATNTATATSTETATEKAFEPDLGQILESVRDNNLPGPAANAIVKAMRDDKLSLEDAVAAQVKLREAYVATTVEKGSVHITESDKPVTGLARAVTVLK